MYKAESGTFFSVFPDLQWVCRMDILHTYIANSWSNNSKRRDRDNGVHSTGWKAKQQRLLSGVRQLSKYGGSLVLVHNQRVHKCMQYFHMRVYEYIFTHSCTPARKHVQCTHTHYICTCIYMHMDTYIWIFLCIYIYLAYARTRPPTHMYRHLKEWCSVHLLLFWFVPNLWKLVVWTNVWWHPASFWHMVFLPSHIFLLSLRQVSTTMCSVIFAVCCRKSEIKILREWPVKIYVTCGFRTCCNVANIRCDVMTLSEHCNTLQHTAPHCTTLHYTAPHRTTLHHTAM